MLFEHPRDFSPTKDFLLMPHSNGHPSGLSLPGTAQRHIDGDHLQAPSPLPPEKSGLKPELIRPILERMVKANTTVRLSYAVGTPTCHYDTTLTRQTILFSGVLSGCGLSEWSTFSYSLLAGLKVNQQPATSRQEGQFLTILQTISEHVNAKKCKSVAKPMSL